MKALFACTRNSFRNPLAGVTTKKIRRDIGVESVRTSVGMIASSARRLLKKMHAVERSEASSA